MYLCTIKVKENFDGTNVLLVIYKLWKIMCRYLTSNGLCAASDGAVTPFPPCEFIRRGREFRQCDLYREYMSELYLNTQYVYDAENDTIIESLSVEPDLNDWEENYYQECPF